MVVLSRFISSMSGSGEVRWILLPRRRSLSPCTHAGDGTGLFRVFALRVFKGCHLWLLDGLSPCVLCSKLLYSAFLRFALFEGDVSCGVVPLFCQDVLLCVAPEWVFQLRVLLLRFSMTSSGVAALGCSRLSSLRHTWICSHPSIA